MHTGREAYRVRGEDLINNLAARPGASAAEARKIEWLKFGRLFGHARKLPGDKAEAL